MEQKKTILIIEDESDLAKMLKIRLELHGYDVFLAFDVAFALLQLKKITPDLIMLDVNLPDMSGIEFYKYICDEHGKTKYPTLMLTARDELKDFFKGMHADGFMTKPFKFEELLASIKRIISANAKSVIYIFDTATNKTVIELKRRMEKEKYEVVIIQDIGSFKAELIKNIPKVIFVEYMQKGMSGEETIKRILQMLRIYFKKKEGESLGISIIVYTFSDGDYAEKSLAAGASWYMGKPTSYMDFINILRTGKVIKKALK